MAAIFFRWPSGLKADVLIGDNGEKFIGRVLARTNACIVFASELGGQLTFPTNRVRELQITPVTMPAEVAALTTNQTNVVAGPFARRDKLDWIQLKSGSWLKGQFKYLQYRKLDFDNDELAEQIFRFRDVRQIYPAGPMWATFDNRPDPVFGHITLGSNNVITVDGPEKFTESRDRLLGLTPAGVRGLPKWSGNFSLGFNRQSGNKTQMALTTSAELVRRTPNTDLSLDYSGNYGAANGEQIANNQRVNLGYDVRFGRDWFWRLGQVEYYEDPLANIGLQMTGNSSLGYYIFDVSGLTWNVAAGPGYQYQRFNTVEAGQSEVSTTAVGALESKFKIDLTDQLDFSVTYRGFFVNEAAGRYTHHTVTKLSYEIKRHLTLDVSYVWDYLASPQQQSNGDQPQKNDAYLAIGLGVRF